MSVVRYLYNVAQHFSTNVVIILHLFPKYHFCNELTEVKVFNTLGVMAYNSHMHQSTHIVFTHHRILEFSRHWMFRNFQGHSQDP